MTVYGSQYVENKVQELRYSAASAVLFWVPKLGGVDVKPTSAYFTVYNAGGTLLSSTSTAVSFCALETEGWLGFDALSARFNIGAQLSNASAGFTATILDAQYSSSTAGRVYLADIYKTVADGKTIVDDGGTPGSATTDGTPYSAVCYGIVDISSASNYPIGENYCARVRWTYGGQTAYDNIYFDVVHAPIPVMTTGRMIDDAHPDWREMRARERRRWTSAIHRGHAELCRRIRALGNRPAFIVKREELQPYEMALIEAEIVRSNLGMPLEMRQEWETRAESIWASRGEFAYADSADDSVIDSTPKVICHRWSR